MESIVFMAVGKALSVGQDFDSDILETRLAGLAAPWRVPLQGNRATR